MLNLDSQFGAHVARRLQTENVIWLTTTSKAGIPQPNPVWFYWDGETFLIYTEPTSAKLKNIHRNPNVSLNFEGADALGGDVVIFTGQASIEEHSDSPHPGYTEKYEGYAAELGYTLGDLYARYSVTIRIRPTRVRSL
jgi:PPOX class probable F420-dependent enzyme